jgi:hypothetical protein
MVCVLQDWSFRAYLPTPYHAPELAEQRLTGMVYGHPKFEDGQRVTTSQVKKSEGRTVVTQNNTYRLGRVSRSYRRWLKQNGIDYNVREPIKSPPPLNEP